MTRLAITGVGAVCPTGKTVDSIWDAVVNGRSAVGPITEWEASRWPPIVVAEVRGIENSALVPDRKLHKFIDRTDMFGLYAAAEAIQQSGLIAYRDALDKDAAARFNDRSGVFVGSGSGGGHDDSNYEFFPTMTAAHGDLRVFGQEFPSAVNPLLLLKHLPNNVLCHIGIRHGFKGANGCIVNQCVGGAMASAEAAAAIRAEEADRATAVGHDQPLTPEIVFYYQQLGLLAPDAVRPFDRARSGTILGEGAAALVLEIADQARVRRAPILGEYLGAGCVTEASGIVSLHPDGEGLRRAIELALADAGIQPREVGMIIAHGNGTRLSDASEAAAIRAVFGAQVPPVTAFKWAFGHLLAASGLLDTVMALHALRHKIVPGIPTLEAVDPELAPLPVSSSPQVPRSDIALIHCRGFGGTNIAVLVRGASQVA